MSAFSLAMQLCWSVCVVRTKISQQLLDELPLFFRKDIYAAHSKNPHAFNDALTFYRTPWKKVKIKPAKYHSCEHVFMLRLTFHTSTAHAVSPASKLLVWL